MSFSGAEEDKFIKTIATYPVIYDLSHADYRNNLVKDNIWKKIGEELSKSSEDCKKKWKFIRDGYNRFKKKHKLGTGLAAPKNCKEKRYQKLAFLESVAQHLSGGTNKQEENTDIEQISYEQQQGGSTDVLSSCNNEYQNSDDKETKIVDKKPQEHEKTILKIKRFKRRNEDKLLKMWKERDERRQTLLKSIVKKKDDDVEHFCRHIAEVLRNLPPVEKAKAKKHLNSVLSDYEIMAAKILTEKNTSEIPRSSSLSNYTFSSNIKTPSPSLECNTNSSKDSAYVLPGPSSAQHYTPGPVHTLDAYSPVSVTAASQEPRDLSLQPKQDCQDNSESQEALVNIAERKDVCPAVDKN